jgi:RNA polymerase sigma factor (sigma-70 family)
MARKFHNVPGVEPDDVRQEARLALYNAAQDHDPAVGTPFRNQAAHYIRNSLIDRYRSQSRRAVEQPTLDEPVGRDRDGLQTTGKDLVRDGSPVPGEATAQADSHDILRSAVSSLPSHLHDVMNDLLAGKSQAEIARDRGVSAQRINAQAKVGLDKLREHFTKQGIGARDLIGGAEVHTPDESELPGAELIKPEDVTIDHDGSTWTEAKDNYDPDDAATWPFANADEIDTYKQAVDGFDKDDPDTWDDFLPAELAGEHGNITDAADEADSLASTLEAQEGISPAVREAARKLEQSIRDQVKDTVLPVAERNYNYAKRVVDDAQAKADAYFADSNDPDVQMSRRDIDEPDTWPKEWSDEYDAAQKQAGLADDDYGPARKMINDVFDAKHGPEIEAAKERVAAKNTEASKASGESQGTLYGAAVDDPPTIGKRLFGDNAFLRDDVAPTVQAIAETFTSAGDSLMKTYAPALRGLEAKHTANILRQNLTEIARNRDHAEAALRKARTFFEGRPVQDNLDFIHAIETNGGIKDPALNEIAQTMRRINNARRDAVRALPTGVFKSFIENYFPHIWKGGEVEDSEAARKFLKKIESSRAFLKHRTIPTIQDGIARGLTPVSFNPVDLFLMRWGQMDRFVAGQKTLGMLKDMGIAQHFPNEEDAPLGWTRIDKRIGLSEEEVPVKTEGDQIPGLEQPPKTVRKKVPYYAPTQAAQVLNNHLSPGLRDKAWYRGIVGAGNALNQAQLGFSAFHLGFTSVDAATSKLAYGLEELAAGRPAHALKAFAQAPLQLGSVFHLLAGRISPSLDTVGGKMHREWMNPGSQSPEIQRLVESVIKAGGRVQQDPLYNNRAWEGFKGAMRRGNYLGGALRAPFALVERASAPIMEYVVPRQKLSVFADMARMGMERLGPGASDEQVRDVMAKAWDSVDNRMGQVVYDNLFWNKVAKDLALASVRSVGWNLGTFRELGGGAVDWGKAGVAAAMMKRPEFTHRMAYTMALPLLTGTIGALVQYLYTGQAPQEPRDYFFPKTGEKDETGHNVRLALPSYMKDVYGFQHDPVHTLTSKIHPMFSAVAQMLQNKDYYGTEISHPGDPLWQRILDEGGFAAKQFLPFSITGQQKMQKSGQSLAKQLLPFVGVTPAPGYVDQSPAEEMAAKFAADRAPTGSQTKQAFDQRQARNLLLNQISKGDNSGIPAAVKAGTVKPGEIAGLLREARQSPLERRFTHLTAEEGAKVFEVATPTEKAILKPMLLRKIQVAAQRGTLPDKRLLKEIASTN